jgi:predicted nucleic acid-binding protein
MSTAFADTSYYFAFLNSKDDLHAQARAFTEGFDGRLLTTAWVLTEIADGRASPTRSREIITSPRRVSTFSSVEIA